MHTLPGHAKVLKTTAMPKTVAFLTRLTVESTSPRLFLREMHSMKLMPTSAVRRVAVTLLLPWCFLAQAAEQSPWESTPFTGEPAAISRAAAAGENAKDVNVVVLLSEDEYSFDTSGSRVSRYYMVYKVLTATA